MAFELKSSFLSILYVMLDFSRGLLPTAVCYESRRYSLQYGYVFDERLIMNYEHKVQREVANWEQKCSNRRDGWRKHRKQSAIE